MNKNLVIFALVVLTVLGSIWGSVANKKKMSLEQQLTETITKLQKLRQHNRREREQILGKTASLQEVLHDKENQLLNGRKELVALRKANKALESKLSGCNAAVQKLKGENAAQFKDLQAATARIARLSSALKRQNKQPASAGRDMMTAGTVSGSAASGSPQEQRRSAQQTIEELRQQLAAASAQIVGLEKIVDEKNNAIKKTAQAMARSKVNMDVLLAKISEQKTSLQQLRTEKQELVKQLAAKDEEIANLREKNIQTPVQQ
ncbi:chromosome partition protein Smc [bacterium BMS3Bbin14]|nr:chromosome partition protein Smc [bacterium BMS3Abin13]GBE51656.1 chromosome partition protein Smc [bacterium BMS3Bbin14]HDK43357.1 hypothetical protein [Desulfobacteraceae bacterium]HDL98455.1 hypothetical protein [Desulfobacteraceae bacterium]HDO29434.1 hypothetical protein [Desulfobacteraceae bacterium]